MRRKPGESTDGRYTAISLFCSGGVGDLAARDVGMEVLVANELMDDRLQVFKHNFPEARVIPGDIWEKKTEIISATKEVLKGRTLDIFLATPPCQGMSRNGQGKLLSAIRKGLKPKFDPRNQLIVPTMEIAVALRPRVIVFENVPAMDSTLIEDPNGGTIRILDFISRELGKDYTGRWEVVEFADYGVPQRRQRLITVFSREPAISRFMNAHDTSLPPRTHSKRGNGATEKWLTVRDVISDSPPLDAHDKKTATSSIPYHRVPILDEKKYFWVSHTPPECGAFDNQCVECGCDDNPTHGAARNKEGINRARKDTPIRCYKCGALLPRPWVEENGEYRLMTGYTSAYKRMAWDKPASALTRNLSYACSDHKMHHGQHSVLSLYEAFHLHTILDFKFEWKRADGKKCSDKTIREIIGESIPPRGLRKIYAFLLLLLEDAQTAGEVLMRSRLRAQHAGQPLPFSALSS